MKVVSRKESLTRRAFASAADGVHMAVGSELFPTMPPERGANKRGKMLGAGASDSVNPSWIALDLVFWSDPEEVLRILSEAAGFRPPERVPNPREVTLEASLSALEETKDTVQRVEAAIFDELAEMPRGPGVRKVDAAARRRRMESA